VKTIAITSFDGPPTLRDDAPAPRPAAGEVLVRVRASSVNPVDRAIASGMFADMFEHEFTVVLGRDYAGVVEQTGTDVTRYAAGDEVFGFLMPATPAVAAGS
jgi:NADPH2:quinone reductase